VGKTLWRALVAFYQSKTDGKGDPNVVALPCNQSGLPPPIRHTLIPTKEESPAAASVAKISVHDEHNEERFFGLRASE
jgi:hypothetical protein